ncbi:MAG TPA: hypothetical protein DCO86_01675 [Spirochaetaceae bacterium]|nr:hypothetical protein [Spirochaetaceae bacterium]
MQANGFAKGFRFFETPFLKNNGNIAKIQAKEGRMKKLACVCVLFSVFAGFAFSQDISPSTDAGASPSSASVSLDKYSLLSEYSASDSAGGGIIARQIKRDRVQVGLSLGALLLFDENDDLSPGSKSRYYAGVNATGKLNGFSGMLGVNVTFDGHYMPVIAGVGYDFEIQTGLEDTRPTYYMRDPEVISTLSASYSNLETLNLTVGLSSTNAIPLSPSYSFTTSLMADLGCSVSLPTASYLSFDARVSLGWAHVFDNLIDVRDYFALNAMIGVSIDVT